MRFVFYRSLMQGRPAVWRLAEGQRTEPAQTADDVALFDLGEFPGMGPAPDGKVTDEVYAIPRELLPSINDYEDYAQLFSREAMGLADGTEAPAYLFWGTTTSD